MTKGPAKSSRVTTTAKPIPPLKQARLIGINDHIKSVRQNPKTYSPAHEGLKQESLAVFGFNSANSGKGTSGRKDGMKTPPPKRRKQLADESEVPETQFAQNTQSPEPGDNETFVGNEAYSSPLSSPPPLRSSPIPANAFITMPPPPLPTAPVTPKRRRVLEVPDSKSPPVTPFTPYASQHRKQENRLRSQLSPTTRLSKSPVVPQIEEGEDSEMDGRCESPTISTQILSQKPFTLDPIHLSRPKRLWHDRDNEQEETERTLAPEEDVGRTERESEDDDRIIKSSQWWENEDIPDALLSTQFTQHTQAKQARETSMATDLQQDIEFREPCHKPVHEETFYVDLSYNSDPPFETNDNENPHESQSVGRMNDEEDIQASFRSMTYPIPIMFHEDTPEPEPEVDVDDPVLPTYEDFPGSTASEEEDPEYIEEGNDSQECPAYGAYRTQQLPSSFYQHHTYRPSSPEIPPSSPFLPLDPIDSVVRDRDYAEAEEEEEEEEEGPSQFLPGMANELNTTPGEEVDDNIGEDGPSQPLPRIINKADTVERDDSQFLPAMVNKSDAVVGSKRDDDNHGGEQDTDIKDEGDDGRVGEGWAGTVTRSQLLPSELMETFPMPPPLSQFSSYGYSYEYGESETQ